MHRLAEPAGSEDEALIAAVAEEARAALTSDVGNNRRPRRRRLRGHLTRRQPGRAVARKPRDFGAEGQCGEAFGLARTRAVDGRSVRRSPAGRRPVWPAGAATRSTAGGLRGPPSDSAPPGTRWSAAASAASTFAVVVSALYDTRRAEVIGALRRQRRSSCADHMIALAPTRRWCGLRQPGVSRERVRATRPVLTTSSTTSCRTRTAAPATARAGFGHRECLDTGSPSQLPAVNEWIC